MSIQFTVLKWTVTLTAAKKRGLAEFYDELLRKGEPLIVWV